jgi:hypothetical protein
MLIKGVKPRTHFKIDVLLFALLITVVLSSSLEHMILESEPHLRFMLHALHGVSGIAMCALLGLHLLLHLPWIRSQLSRIIKPQS